MSFFPLFPPNKLWNIPSPCQHHGSVEGSVCYHPYIFLRADSINEDLFFNADVGWCMGLASNAAL